MRIPKKYGQSKIDNCPFCDKVSFTRNPQGIPVCKEHQSKSMPNLKCLCGEYLDLKFGKYGPFYSCIKCGTMNISKALDMNPRIFE